MALILLAVGVSAQNGHKTLDTENSVIEWIGTKVTGSHRGTMKLQEGYVEIEDGIIRGGRFIFDMTSIEDTDISDGNRKLRLEEHLRSADFFDVQNHPTAVFQIISATPSRLELPGEQVFQVSGDLTIKGITHVMDFDAIVALEDDRATAKGDITVDRTRYDIKYRSGKIYEGLGDRMIHDDFRIIFNLTTK